MTNEIELYQPLTQYLVYSGAHGRLPGYQAIFRFDNDYGASVVQTPISYTRSSDEVEIAVLKFDADGSWDLTYDTPITDDVIGHLSFDEAIETLLEIKALPADNELITG